MIKRAIKRNLREEKFIFGDRKTKTLKVESVRRPDSP
jgi:hypothetical protein